MEARISLITLGVTDLGRATAFYEGLGWRRGAKEAEGVAFFQLNGMILSLFPFNSLAEDAGLPSVSLPDFRGVALAHNVRGREEVDDLVARMKRLGGRIVRPAEEKSWGGYAAYVADPDGHLWEIAWNPGFSLGPNGEVILPA